jgi:Hydantoinase/oxoprolinase N-terminal region
VAWRIGVDSGGTFTDVCLFDETSGRIAVWKVSSTPSDPSLAVMQGVSEALGSCPCFDDHNHQTGVLRLKSRMNQPGSSQKRRVFSGFFTTLGVPPLSRCNIALLVLGFLGDLNLGAGELCNKIFCRAP